MYASLTRFSSSLRPQKRKSIPQFYKPFLGASYFKSPPRVNYKVLSDSLMHFPKPSTINGSPLDWASGDPRIEQEVLGASQTPNMIRLDGIVMGKTPEFLQESLKRFFCKYGRILSCRVLPHAKDPYQASGVGFVQMDSAGACLKAIRGPPLRMNGPRGDVREIKLTHLASNTRTSPGKFRQLETACQDLVSLVCLIHSRIVASTPLQWVALSMTEHVATESTSRLWSSVDAVFGDEWYKAVQIGTFSKLLRVRNTAHGPQVLAMPLAETDAVRRECSKAMRRQLINYVSPHWRQGKVELPDYTKHRATLHTRKPALPFELQLMSRDFKRNHVFSEKLILEHKRAVERKNARLNANKGNLAIGDKSETSSDDS